MARMGRASLALALLVGLGVPSTPWARAAEAPRIEFGVDGVVVDQVAPVGWSIDVRSLTEDVRGNTYVLYSAFPGGTQPGVGGVVKYTSSGSRDTTFGTNGVVAVDVGMTQIFMHRSGALVLGGVGAGGRLHTLSSDGTGLRSIDPGLPSDAITPGRGAGPIVDLGDGRLVALGDFSTTFLVVEPDLSVTQVDRPRDVNGNTGPSAIVLTDGTIVYQSYIQFPASVCMLHAVRADLTPSESFGAPSIPGTCPLLTALPDGSFITRGPMGEPFQRRRADGSPGGTVPSPPNTNVIAVEGTGRIVTVTSGGSSPDRPLVLDAYWPDGTTDPFIDTTIDLPISARPYAMPSGDILVAAGSFGEGTLFLAATESFFGGIGPQFPAVPLTAFTPLTPERLLDTRLGLGAPRAPVPAGRQIMLQVTGRGGVPAGAAAVVLNVTATEAFAPGFVTVWPTDSPRPVVSSLNLDRAGQTAANLVTVKLSASGAVSMFSMAGTHLVADVLGFYTEVDDVVSAGRFQAVTPNRILDTREGIGAPLAALPAGGQVDLQVLGRSGVPTTGVSAVVMNVTATNTAGPGFFTVWPTGRNRPTASNLNVEGGDTRPNLVIVPVGADGKVSLFSQRGADLIADVAGWFTDASAPESDGGLFAPLAPRRILDTRYGGRPPLAAATTTRTQVGATTLAPPGITGGLVLNVTAADTSLPGFVTLWEHGGIRPGVSNLNISRAGQVVANAAIVGIPLDDDIDIFNQPPTSLIVDLFGYYVVG